MNSSLKERFARPGPIQAIDRVPFGSPGALVLRTHPDLTTVKTVSAALSLCRRGASMLEAKRALEAMLEDGCAAIHLPKVEDSAVLAQELAASGVIVTPNLQPMVDVRSLRSQLGLSLDDFSLRYGLDRETVADWETGRAMPDSTARSYLRVIQKLPEEARRAVAEAS
ncbi:helix-turn-helix domain-containing protein [Methylobacterium sp. Gmos1]